MRLHITLQRCMSYLLAIQILGLIICKKEKSFNSVWQFYYDQRILGHIFFKFCKTKADNRTRKQIISRTTLS